MNGGRKTLKTKYGAVRLLAKNPRIMRESARSALKRSLDRDPDFMRYGKIFIDEKNVVLSGNQRFKAFLDMGYDSIPDEWIERVQHKDGTPFTQEEKERFVYIMNSPEGISGEFDYAAMVEGTSLDLLRDVGIDLSRLELPQETREEFEGRAETEIETESPMGEESETLKDLHRKRAESKEKFEDMTDCGFYAVLVFQNRSQRRAFAKWCADRDVRQKYEGLYLNGEDFAKAVGAPIPEDKGKAIRERLPSAVLEGMTLDGAGASEGAEAGEDGEE